MTTCVRFPIAKKTLIAARDQMMAVAETGQTTCITLGSLISAVLTAVPRGSPGNLRSIAEGLSSSPGTYLCQLAAGGVFKGTC